MAAGDGAQLPATVAASRSVEKALEEAAASGALNLSNRKLKEFPRSARNYDLSDITHAGRFVFTLSLNLQSSTSELAVIMTTAFCFIATCFFLVTGRARPSSAPTRFTRVLQKESSAVLGPDDCHSCVPGQL